MISWERQFLPIIWAYVESNRTCLTDEHLSNTLDLDCVLERWTPFFNLLDFMTRQTHHCYNANRKVKERVEHLTDPQQLAVVSWPTLTCGTHYLMGWGGGGGVGIISSLSKEFRSDPRPWTELPQWDYIQLPPRETALRL